MGGPVHYRFAKRMHAVPTSFLGELFRVSSQPDIISFAGGLPDASLFDLSGLREAAIAVLDDEGACALQYTTTDGYLPLRRYIADRYSSSLGLNARPEEIQIVNGSQQCLDLIAKILVSPGDHVCIERPGYLGAIEAFSFYEPVLDPVRPAVTGPVGPDTELLEKLIADGDPAFFYCVPNSQNPSGLTWDEEKRKEVSEILNGSDTLLYEDDAFGELFFDGRRRQPVKRWLSDKTIMSGSFSKTIAPGLRCGWIWAPEPIICEFNRAKQAADLHSNLVAQMILTRYLTRTDIDTRIRNNARIYGRRCRLMCDCIEDQFPPGTGFTRPEGGMFLLITLPPGLSSIQVFEEGIRKGVAVMPGLPFYVDGGGTDTIRLNFSSSPEEDIAEGMDRLSRVVTGLS